YFRVAAQPVGAYRSVARRHGTEYGTELSGDRGTRLIDRPPGAVLFRDAGAAVTAADLLREAQALAARLPDGRHLLNLCRDRYAFAVTFLAALLREQVCLL